MGDAKADPVRLSSSQRFVLSVVRTLASLRVLRPRAGHYYSPIPSRKEVRRHAARIFDRSLRDLPGVDLNVEDQLRLLDQLKEFYGEQPFGERPRPGMRYSFGNFFYGCSDAIFLYSIIRFARPKRIIEIGSGFSSFVMLDTNELFFDSRIRLTFVEPNAKRLRSRLKPRDREATVIVEKRVQDVELGIFRELSEGDILFVDSSHVSKAGSDVNHILFEILPSLAEGVFIHFHDIHYPFEYPRQWIEYGMSWNEPYLLHAFLQYNSKFIIRLWNNFLMTFYVDSLRDSMPLCTKPDGFGVGGSLWLQRV